MGFWKKLIPTLMDDIEGFKITVEEGTDDVEKQQENWNQKWTLKMWLNCCNLMIKLKWMKSCFSWISKESGFLRWNYWWRCYEVVEMTAKYLEYYINLIDKPTASLKELTFDFERSPTPSKLSQRALHTTKKLFMKARDRSATLKIYVTNFIAILF